MNTENSQHLRDDIRLLGELLGLSIQKLHSSKDLELVERVRVLSKEARAGSTEISTDNNTDKNTEARQSLIVFLEQLNDEQILLLAKAFNQFLNQANIAEQHHRMRRRRHYETVAKPRVQKLSMQDSYSRLKGLGHSSEKIFSLLMQISIDLVLTAHPTEVLRRALIHPYNSLAAQLRILDMPDRTVQEDREALEELERLIESIWLTDEVRNQQPSPLDEVRGGLHLIEDIFWDLVPNFLRQLDRVTKAELGRELPKNFSPFKISSWMGSDKDGNPFVLADMTRKALQAARLLLKKLYLVELRKLQKSLSINHAPASFYAKLQNAQSFEPYRDYFQILISKIETDAYKSSKELIDELQTCFESLEELGAHPIANGPLLDLIRRVQCFGFCLMPLDIRQSSDVHERCVTEVVQKTRHLNYTSLCEKDRVQVLDELLGQDLSSLPKTGWNSELQDLIETLRLTIEINPDVFKTYVISMTESASDLLEVALIQKLALDQAHAVMTAPLFETPQSLDQACSIVEDYLSTQFFKQWNPSELQIMIGYSDSAKRAGRFASAWKLYQVQLQLSALAKKNQLEIQFFHGRGGSVGRGGGPTYHALQGLPPGSLSGKFRITEQGESLQAKFGLPDIGHRTLELYLTGTLQVLTSKTEVPTKWTSLAQEFSDLSEKHFFEFIYESPRFVEYFESVSPEAELSGLRIGSRPVRRKSKKDLESLRAIPWIFAWTQNRSLMASWFGIGEALEELVQNGKLALLQDMYQNWPFFSSTLHLVEMVLSKSDMGIFKHYTEQLVPKELQFFSEHIVKSHQKTIQLLLQVTRNSELLAINPTLKRSIQVRNPYVDLNNFLQVLLLKKIRLNSELPQRDALTRALMTTLVGVASGMRNTG